MDQKQETKFYKMCEGVAMPEIFPEEAFKSALTYQPKKGEIVVATYPKCGTSWMQHIVLLILRHGKVSDDPTDFFLGCPFLEMLGAECVEILQPPTIRTHIPFHKIPYSKDAKYIYVCRNPKDCVVSFYYHMKGMPPAGLEETTFDDFFELFIKGEVPYGDYFDHVMAWYEHKDDPNIYIVTYENLKKDIRGEILKLAKFIGEEYEKVLLDDSKILDDIIYYSSFDYMKKDTNETVRNFAKGESQVSHDGKEFPPALLKAMEAMGEIGQRSNAQFQFLRKGIIGDWKNHLSLEQSRRLEERIAEKTANSNVMSLWA